MNIRINLISSILEIKGNICQMKMEQWSLLEFENPVQ